MENLRNKILNKTAKILHKEEETYFWTGNIYLLHCGTFFFLNIKEAHFNHIYIFFIVIKSLLHFERI